MGKKVSQATTLKISKNNNERHQLNNLIKVLKPKVYITDISRFKKLVQELTGNGSSTTLSPPPLEPKVVENSPIIANQQDQGIPESGFEALVDQRDHEISFEASVSPETTTTTTNSDELCYSAVMSEEFDEIYKHICLDDGLLEDCVGSQLMGADDLFAYQNLESLVFDVEAADQFYSCYEQIQQGEVSIYDYELSGLI